MTKPIILPGQIVSRMSPFELKIGTKVFDKESGKTGIISDIRETKPEWIETFIELDGQEEIEAYLLPKCVILEER